MSTYIRSQIAQRQQRLADIERQTLVLKAELRAYEDALAHMEGGQSDALPPAITARVARQPQRSGGQGRSLQATSSAIVIAAVKAYPKAISLDDAEAAVMEATGEPVKRHNVRTSCWSNANANLLERVSDGFFKATAEGAKRVGMTLPAAEPSTSGVQAVDLSEGGAEAGVDEGPHHADGDLLGERRPLNPLPDERTDAMNST